MSEVNKIQAEITELESKLKSAYAAKTLAEAARAKSVDPIYRFTLSPVEDKFEKIYDDSCRLYLLAGKVLNKDELQAVGKVPFEGGMNYLYNSLSNKFVVAVGGGSTFFGSSHLGTDTVKSVLSELGEFIKDSPQGGDVTSIMNRYRSA